MVQEAQEQTNKENEYLDSIGFNEDAIEPQEVDFQSAGEINKAIEAESTAVSQTAKEGRIYRHSRRP